MAENAVNGILPDGSLDVDDMFHSDSENYPWLAIDLGFYYKVSFTSVIFNSHNILLHYVCYLGNRGVNGRSEWLLC